MAITTLVYNQNEIEVKLDRDEWHAMEYFYRNILPTKCYVYIWDPSNRGSLGMDR